MSNSPADERTRVGREATREALIEATAQIVLGEGYAAGTSRRVAANVGVKPGGALLLRQQQLSDPGRSGVSEVTSNTMA